MDNRRTVLLGSILIAAIAILAFIIIWSFVSTAVPDAVAIAAVVGLVFVAVIAVRYLADPDYVRARQSDRVLYLANHTLSAIQGGLNEESAQAICDILLPYTGAVAMSLTDDESTLGYSGISGNSHPRGSSIDSRATQMVLEEGKSKTFLSPTEMDLPSDETILVAAIVVPLKIGDHTVGTMSFFYHKPEKVTESQRSLAVGLSKLLSTQLTAGEVDRQTELATRMELKALQAQINPHFLFNTINTIASLIRTDPARARELLREFAVFYRRTLENSEDLISIDQEIEQTERYFKFVQARFGEDRVELSCDMEEGLSNLRVPSFIIQPLVENCINHAMRDSGKLHITIVVHRAGEGVEVCVVDDGVGIKPDVLPHTLEPGFGTGMGIALKNVDDRLKGYFGHDSGITIESVYGEGTTVHLLLADVALSGMENTDA